jgi:hypothetical protein
MKTFEEILEEVCQERLSHNWGYLRVVLSHVAKDAFIKEAAQRYSRLVAQDALNRAAENADFQECNGYPVKNVITETEIITL